MKEIELNEIEKKIYDEMIESIRTKSKRKISEIAKKLDVPNSSVVKVTQKLGYSGWKEMYYSLSHANNDKIPMAFDNFNFINQNVSEELELLCQMIIKYKKECIVIQTIGDVGYLDYYLLTNFWNRGFQCYMFSPELIQSLSEQNKAGIALFINESGIIFLENCVYMKNHDFNVISITSNQESPLSANSHISIEIKNHKSNLSAYEPNFFTARVMLFLELLFVKIDEMS